MKGITLFLLFVSFPSVFVSAVLSPSPNPPVELSSFTAQVEDSCVNLAWITATELNNLGFAVERAIQVGLWEEIGFVDGNGTTNEPRAYEFVDSLFNVVAERVSYRLKQIDFDGTFHYSDEIEILLQQVTLRDTTNQYDYIIITVPEFVTACEPFRQHKETVRDFRTLIVDTTQIFAEFDSSAAPQNNIRDFISYAGTFWKEPRPKYFMLVGDLSKVPAFPDVFDFGPYLDTAYTDFKYSVNTFSSDTSTSTFQIGRLPAKYEYEIQNYTAKVIIYETDTTYSAWMNNNLFVKQTYPDNSIVHAYNETANFLLSQYPAYFNNSVYAESDSLPQGQDRDSILNYLNTTSVNSLWLIGHAFPTQFSYFCIIDTSDINQISNEPRYFITFFLAHQKFTFGADDHGLANRFILDDEAAINVVAPVGYTFLNFQTSLLSEVSNNLFGVERKTLGEALNHSRNYFTNSYTIRMLNLWGDPSIFPKYDIPADVISEESFPMDFTLFQNYPNPFNPTTTIKFALPIDSRIKINVYNSLGQLVETLADQEMESGYHEVNFDASRYSSGVYLYQLQAGEYVSVKKMLLLK